MVSEDFKEGIDEAISQIDRESLSQFQLCDTCLGRLFAKVGMGMENSARGIIARQLLDYPACEDTAQCKVCQGITSKFDHLAELAMEAMKSWEHSNFLIGTKFEPEVLAAEEQVWAESQAAHTEPIKAEFNREIGKRIEKMTGVEVEFGKPHIVAIVDTLYESVDIQVAPMYMYGRYQKHSREIPQTRWPCRQCNGKGCDRCNETGMMYPNSVEELAGRIALKYTKGTDHRFHGMGREDIDALMLGRGRPFVLEIKEPKIRTLDLQKLQKDINESTDMIIISELRNSDSEEVVKIKSARPNKSYRVKVAFSTPVTEENFKEVVVSLGGISIAQRTPQRVSHRRADMVRERTVEKLQAKLLSPTEAEIDITAEAGTYIKEFVHSDEGRTVPSIAGKLGVKCEVKTLDVLEIIDE